MNEAKSVDVDEVMKALLFKAMTGQKLCYLDGTAVKYIAIEDIRSVILNLNAQVRAMQESYDDAVAEQAKLSETNTAMKIYEKAVEFYDEPTSLVVSYHKMMDWMKEYYCLEKVKVSDECKIL